MSVKPRDIIKRMMEAVGVRSLAALARHLGIDPSAINAAIRQRRLPEAWLYKVAGTTERSVEWLRTGKVESQLWLALAAALRQARELETLRGRPGDWAAQRGVLERLVSEIERSVQTLEAGDVAAESVPPYGPPPKFLSLLTRCVTNFTGEELHAVLSFISALESGDDQVREHLINQMKVVERALTTRRTRAKKSELA